MRSLSVAAAPDVMFVWCLSPGCASVGDRSGDGRIEVSASGAAVVCSRATAVRELLRVGIVSRSPLAEPPNNHIAAKEGHQGRWVLQLVPVVHPLVLTRC